MMWSGLLFTILAVVVVAQELPLAGPCNPVTCQLPSCRCSATAIPGGLAPRNTPQFVMVTFDDSVNIINMETYRDILYNRFNFNGCRAGATFYVSHEYTNYQLINELYNQGFEIALHTISHQTPSTYWQQATVETLRREIGDQKEQMAHFANIPQNAIHGVRMPFLQMAGNNTFIVKNEYGLTYDCSMPTNAFVSPGLWPYTLHHASIQDCLIPPCPTASIPGPWVIPMVSWSDLQGVPCSMADGCHFTPDMDDEEGWFQFIVRNFERHYLTNRAPFGYFVHEWYVRTNPGVRAALIRFMNMINSLPDVFMVNSMDVIEWARNPVPVDQYRARSCRFTVPAFCPAASCGPLPADHNPHNPHATYWMQICNSCPRVHPWVGNHLGR